MGELLPQNIQNQITGNTTPSELTAETLMQILHTIRPGLMFIDTMQGDFNVYGQSRKPFPASVNRYYYNLFVIPGAKIKSEYFQMPMDRCLNEKLGTESSIAKWLCHLQDIEIQAEILKFPSILATTTNIIDGRIDPLQQCQYGFLSDISICQDSINFEFNFSDGIDQSVIESLSNELRLKNNPRATELSVIHWAVKRADLAKILTDNGQDIKHPQLRK